MKLISVIIPYFNKIKFINKAIDSVLHQTYKKFEIIIVYDSENNEDYFKILEIKKKDKRIKIIKNNKNLGAGESRNKAIKFSNGSYIAFLDADDFWHKDKLKLQLKFMQFNNLSFSHTSYHIVDKNNKILGKRKAPLTISYNTLIKSCDIGLSTVLIKKKIIGKTKFPRLKTKEDYVFWLSISKKGFDIAGINRCLTGWRRLENSLSSSIFQKILDGYRVYRLYLKFSFFRSIFSLLILSSNYLKKEIKK
jgi:teichuronic acid biosynthesis glycosyltransferase TuaG